MNHWLDLLRQAIQMLPVPPSRVWVGYSGGVDSTVLLHLACQLGLPVHAIHVNHGVSACALDWERHCLGVCEQLNVPLTVKRLEPMAIKTEAALRKARYAAYLEALEPEACLLLGHHLSDQVETVLFRLFRGTGPQGLAGMKFWARMQNIHILRPLLSVPKSELVELARKQGWPWVEDESNQEVTYHRNYIRHQLIPVIVKEWPWAEKAIAHLASLVGEQNEWMKSHLECDCITAPDKIDLKAFSVLNQSVQKTILHHWLEQNACRGISSVLIDEILNRCIGARQDANPVVCWHGGEVRRYKECLYVMQPLSKTDTTLEGIWNLLKHSQRQWSLGSLSVRIGQGEGLKLPQPEVQVRYRRTKDRIKLPGRNHHQTLKNFFQEKHVPPWLRVHWPLIIFNEDLVCIPGLWIAEQFAAQQGQSGFVIEWSLR